MVNQASTVMAIEYQMVLDNIAMFTVNPGVLPWHVKIKEGTVQINDEGGIPEFGAQWGNSPNFTRGVRAVRSITEQWGADAVTDPRRVKRLQDIYRKVVGLPPEPDPPFFKAIVSFHTQAQRLPPVQGAEAREPLPEPIAPNRGAATDGQATANDQPALKPNGGPPADSGSGRDNSELDSMVLKLEISVPTGWFCVGRKKDVPKNASFVGHYCDQYVWVMPHGVSGLSEFTLIILALTELTPREASTSRGLMFTR